MVEKNFGSQINLYPQLFIERWNIMKIRVLKERKLTDAEEEKREKIAMAMEKENPGMPMDKKMAIATAQAKKNEEQLEEMSAMSAGAVSGPADVEDSLEEMYSTTAVSGPAGLQRIQTDAEFEGRVERGRHQGVQNYKENKNYFHDNWRQFLKD